MQKDYFYSLLGRYLAVHIRPGNRVLHIDPRTSRLPRSLPAQEILVLATDGQPIEGVNCVTDFAAAKKFGPDYIILNGNIQHEEDILAFLQRVREICTADTHVLVLYYSSVWRPQAGLASLLGWRERTPRENWTAPVDVENFAALSDFEQVKREQKILLPLKIPLLSDLVNRWIAPLPGVRELNLVNLSILRPLARAKPKAKSKRPSVSVVVPARNEAGNIEAAIQRIPKMGPRDELIFVEGNSTDETWDVIQKMAEKYTKLDDRKIKIARQEGVGKKDAVYKGFSLAENEILMILDADLTVPPEDLPKFYQALTEGKGEFINGSRLVYLMEDEAMRFLNMIGNKFFAMSFSFVLNQRLRDTLCGTKVFTREIYDRISRHRDYFGDFDPFGDFDLIFGADRMGLKIVEVPVRYRARTYGSTNISRFRHGLILLRMLQFAARKLKFI